MAKELKPCPFCGGEARIENQYVHKWVVGCESFGCICMWLWSYTPLFSSREEAVKAWNTRANDANEVDGAKVIPKMTDLIGIMSDEVVNGG